MSDEYPRNRDPLDILLWKESKSCKGCTHEMKAILWGEKVVLCDKKQPYGKRCKHYEGKA